MTTPWLMSRENVRHTRSLTECCPLTATCSSRDHIYCPIKIPLSLHIEELLHVFPKQTKLQTIPQAFGQRTTFYTWIKQDFFMASLSSMEEPMCWTHQSWCFTIIFLVSTKKSRHWKINLVGLKNEHVTVNRYCSKTSTVHSLAHSIPKKVFTEFLGQISDILSRYVY